jgi:hypothetical protein
MGFLGSGVNGEAVAYQVVPLERPFLAMLPSVLVGKGFGCLDMYCSNPLSHP